MLSCIYKDKDSDPIILEIRAFSWDYILCLLRLGCEKSDR